MVKKFNTYIYLRMIIAILLIIIGMIIFIYPGLSLNVIAIIIGIIAIILGVYQIILGYRCSEYSIVTDFALNGILSLLFGILLLIYPNLLNNIIPIILGLSCIIDSVIKFRLSLFLSDSKKILGIIMSILSFICGLVFMINPLTSSEVIMSVLAILLMVYAVTDLVDVIIFKKDMDNIYKKIKEKLSIFIK